MKKFKSILALLLLGALTATGCGEKKTPSNSDPGSQQSDGGNGSQNGDQGGNGGQQGGGGQQSGEGGEGGQHGGGEGGGEGQQDIPQDSRFYNKKLAVQSVSTQPQVPAMETMYASAYAAFFQDGSCELVAPHDATYDVLFGTYGVNALDNVATISVKKSFDGAEQMYSWSLNSQLRTLQVEYLAGSDTFELRILFTYPATTLTLTLSALPNPPMHIVGDEVPADPNGDSFDAQYQVEQYRFNQFFVNDVIRQRNFTVNASIPGYMPGIVDNYKVEVQGLKVRYSVEDNALAESYYFIDDFVRDGSGEIIGVRADVYHKDVGGNWVETENSLLAPDFFQNYFGFIPVEFLKTEYSTFTHCYSASSVEYRDSNDIVNQVTQFKAYFENDNIKKISFKDEIQENHEYNFSAHGSTVVEIPDVGGGGGGGGGDPQPAEWPAAKVASYLSKMGVEHDTLPEASNASVTRYIFYPGDVASVDNYFSITCEGGKSLENTYEAALLAAGYHYDDSEGYWITTNAEIAVAAEATGQDFDIDVFKMSSVTPQPTPYVHYSSSGAWSDAYMESTNENLAQITPIYLEEGEEFTICLGGDEWLYYEDYRHDPDTAGGMITQGSETIGGHNFHVGENGNYNIYVNAVKEVYITHETSGGGGGGGDPQPVVPWPADYCASALSAWGVTNDTVPALTSAAVTSYMPSPETVTASDDDFMIVAMGGENALTDYLGALGSAGYSTTTINGMEMYATTYEEIAIYVYAYSGNLFIFVYKMSSLVVPFSPYILYYDGNDFYPADLMYDDVKEEYYFEDLYLGANFEFLIYPQEDVMVGYESFVICDPDTANGAVVEGEEVATGLHTFRVQQDGGYSIYLNSVGEVYIVYGNQAPSEVFIQYNGGYGWDNFIELEEDPGHPDQYYVEGVDIFQDTEFVIRIGYGDWRHYEDIHAEWSNAEDKFGVGTEVYGSHNFVCLEDGTYNIYVKKDADTEGGSVILNQEIVDPKAYPSKAIASFLGDGCDPVPAFEDNHVNSYLFEDCGKYGLLTINVQDDMADDIAINFEILLQVSGFGVKLHLYAGYTYVSPQRHVGVAIYANSGNEIEIYFYRFNDEDPDLYPSFTVDYELRCENDWDIFADDARLYAWVMGGTYGEGEWIELSLVDSDEKLFGLYGIDDSATAINIVRFVLNNPDDDNWEPSWETSEWYNQTDDIDISGNSTSIYFEMHNR